MNVFAQFGFGPKDKISRGLLEGNIDGGIVSPRYSKPERARERVQEIHEYGGVALFDPEFYATGVISHPEPNLGSLEEWDYFESPRRPRLISGAGIPNIIRKTVEAQADLGVDECIAPNLFIRNADSIDTAIALNFLNQTKASAQEVTDLPVYGTFAIHRDALLSANNFRDILDGLTGLDTPPDGYYIIVGSNEMQSTGSFIRSDLYHPEIIAAWMYVNYVLSLNGAKVINGYCFQFSPLLAICGADACASGWSSGLRKFCIDKYIRSGTGGSQPNPRYLSLPLLSYIRKLDYDNYNALGLDIVNDLSLDAKYEVADVDQTHQALQIWEALTDQVAGVSGDLDKIDTELARFNSEINEAQALWAEIRSAGLVEEVEQNVARLEAMKAGITLFSEWAELA